MVPAKTIDILGITSASGGFHDSSVAWIRNGRIEFALSEERISRIKHDYAFPRAALQETLRFAGLEPRDFAQVAVSWLPYRSWSGFFDRSIWDVPKTVGRSLIADPRSTWAYARDNFFRKKIVGSRSLLEEHGFRPEQIRFVSHHLAHAASSFRTSGYDEALSVNLDCFGPDDRGNLWSGAAFHARQGKLELLEYIPPYASLGLFYSAVSVALGFRFGDGEGKTMGLAAYGRADKTYDALRTVSPFFRGGHWHGHESWSDFRLIDRPALLFSTKWGRFLRELIRIHSREDVAAAAQRILEEELACYFDFLLKKTRLRRVVLAGGTFLNVTFNRKLAERSDVEAVFVHPFPSDGGAAAGAALELSAQRNELPTYEMTSAALGPEFSNAQILGELTAGDARFRYEKSSDIAGATALQIEQGRIVGWFQGRAEWGPRALGQRSVLGDPRNAATKERLNQLLKSRDWFMPFAPSILEESAADYFESSFYTPFMTFAFKVRPEKAAVAPGIVHADGTARPNMVRASVNPLYHRLIKSFAARTGVPIVLNTSFNRHGLPLVNTPKEALDHLAWGCVDALAIGDYLVHRKTEIERVDDFARQALLHAYTDEQAHAQAWPK